MSRYEIGRRTILGFAAAMAAPALARAQARSVTMYSAMPTDILNALVPAYKAKSGVEVQVVSAGSGELMKRLQAEATRPLADALISVGADGIDANPTLFESYDPPGSDKFIPGLRYSRNWLPFTVTLPAEPVRRRDRTRPPHWPLPSRESTCTERRAPTAGQVDSIRLSVTVTDQEWTVLPAYPS